MPLFETILIARPGTAAQTKNLLRNVTMSVIKSRGNMRSIRVLGDRIMAKSVFGRDTHSYKVGRYIQLLYDGKPEASLDLEKEAKLSQELLFIESSQIKDHINEAIAYRRASQMTSPVISEHERNQEFLEALKKFKEAQPSL